MNTTAILADIAQIEAALTRIRAQLAPESTAPLVPANDAILGPDMIQTGTAAQIARVSKVTIVRWAVRHGIGGKVGGRWLISKIKLEAFILSQAA